ncbi:ABC transporter permease [Brevibacterium sp.]|uniref:ABC transporter permease n=1 Tax=Brevibacterium sp. TaxID=1701 RepID=UPI0028127199|nr:ABC transporter permease [Brevibacterium sp.]
MTTDISPAAPSPAPPPTAEARPGQEQSTLQQILSGSWLVSLLAIVLALLLGGVLIAVSNAAVIAAAANIGSAPGVFFSTLFSTVGEAYSALFRGAVFDWNARTTERAIRPLTESLVSGTPLILAGLGIALAFRSGLFNIGGQGQVILGATVAGFLGYALELPAGVHMLLAALGGLIGGAIWAGIAGVLKAKTGANEVIVTIMLNSIAGYLLGYLLKQNWFTHTSSANPQSRVIDESAEMFLLLPPPFRLHFGFIIAVLATIFVWWLLERSTIGFEFKAVGANPHAAKTAGISVSKVTILVMLIAGALAGLGGAAQVLGTEGKLTGGISGSIGFDAITVALLGRSKPLGTFFAGLLFGAFKAGGYLMQSQTGTPIDIVLVVQSVIVLLIAAPPLVRSIFRLPTPVLKRKES